MRISQLLRSAPRSCTSIVFGAGPAHACIFLSGRVLYQLAVGTLPALFLLNATRDQVYNVLWTLVFGFATLNILSLGARRFESQKSGLNFGEALAILVVIISIILLGWEMLYVFHVLPIRFSPH